MDSLYPVMIGVLLMAWTCLVMVWFRLGLKRKASGKLAPGPRPLPIVGNIFQLGSAPAHEVFTKLAQQYGPLVSIQLGGMYGLIVSSPEMAREILLKKGQAFSSRNLSEGAKACDHHKFSMVFMPTSSTKWKDMRRICKERMFSNQSLEAGEVLRQEKVRQLLDHVQNCCDTGRTVEIRKSGFITMLNLMTATLFSFQATEFDSEGTREFSDIISGISIAVGKANFADFFPILRPFDPQGVRRGGEIFFGKLLAKVDTYLNERLESRRTSPNGPKKNDFLEQLIDSSEVDEFQIDNDDIRHLLVDLMVGGAETANSTLIEWTMSELILNPDKMAKVKDELNTVIGEKRQVLESDIPNLPYLQAAVKEVMRTHPPGPLLLPRTPSSDQVVNGYLVPKGTQILVNLWAMGRNPTIWPNPESFEPERFLDKTVDFKGQDFELIPFGAGRRICPGFHLAHRMLHAAVANLLHNFDWILEGPEQRDISQTLHGFVLCRSVPLRAIPIKP